MKLSAAQERTLDALQQAPAGREWMDYEIINYFGGHSASLPKLVELGLIEKRDHPTRQRHQWRFVAA